MSFNYYYDFLSQPSRAVYIFLKLNKIPFESCPVALRHAENRTEKFKEQKNRFQAVPFIHDGNLKLAESVAIVRYLSAKYGINNNWYPKDLTKRARVDEYLEWQHNNTRALCCAYTEEKWLLPLSTGKPADPTKLKQFEKHMVACLDQIEELWLKDGAFLTGNEISVADIFAACELEEPRLAEFDPFKGRPRLTEWIGKVRQECSPYYQEAHAMLNKVVEAQTKVKL